MRVTLTDTVCSVDFGEHQTLVCNGRGRFGCTLRCYGWEHHLAQSSTLPLSLAFPVVDEKLGGLAEELWRNRALYGEDRVESGIWETLASMIGLGSSKSAACVREEAAQEVERRLRQMIDRGDGDTRAVWTLFCVAQSVLRGALNATVERLVRIACYEFLNPRLVDERCLGDLLEPTWRTLEKPQIMGDVGVFQIFTQDACEMLYEESRNMDSWIREGSMDVKRFRVTFQVLVEQYLGPMVRQLHPGVTDVLLKEAYFIHHGVIAEEVHFRHNGLLPEKPHLDRCDLTLITCVHVSSTNGTTSDVGGELFIYPIEQRDPSSTVKPDEAQVFRPIVGRTVGYSGKARHGQRPMQRNASRTSLVLGLVVSFSFERFFELPRGVMELILDFLPPCDLGRFAQAGKACTALVEKRQWWFEAYCERKVPGVLEQLKKHASTTSTTSHHGHWVPAAVCARKKINCRMNWVQFSIWLQSTRPFTGSTLADSIVSELLVEIRSELLMGSMERGKRQALPDCGKPAAAPIPIAASSCAILPEGSPESVALRCVIQ